MDILTKYLMAVYEDENSDISDTIPDTLSVDDAPNTSVSKKVTKKIAELYGFNTLQNNTRINLQTINIDEIKTIITSIPEIEFVKIIIPNQINKKLYKASGVYTSYLFKLKIDCEYGKKGQYGLIINAITTKDTNSDNNDDGNINKNISYINRKQLTPDALNLNQYSKLNLESLQEITINNIQNTKLNDTIKTILKNILHEVIDNTKSIERPSDNIIEFKQYKDTIVFSKELHDLLIILNNKDINTICVDFGEVLGAAHLLKKYNAHYVEFPSVSNYELVDFFIEGQGISSKFNKGAAASVKIILDQLNEHIDIKKNIEENKYGKLLIQLLEIIYNNPAGYGTLLCHQLLNTKFYIFMKQHNLLHNDVDRTIKEINNFIRNNPHMLNDIYMSILDGKTVDQSAIQELISYKELDAAGLLISPATYNLISILNNDENIMNMLKKMLNIFKIKQLYLFLKLNLNSIIFELKCYDIADFKFSFRGTSKDYKRVKLGFKML